MDETLEEAIQLLQLRAEIQDLFNGPDPGRRVLRWLMKRRGGVLIVPPRSGGSPPRRRAQKAVYRRAARNSQHTADRATTNATRHTTTSNRNARSMMILRRSVSEMAGERFALYRPKGPPTVLKRKDRAQRLIAAAPSSARKSKAKR
jgi:hypothetical protein